MKGFTFETCHTIVAEPGAVSALAKTCRGLGIRRPLLVTDAGILSVGLHDEALRSFKKDGIDCVVFSKVQADPSEAVVLAALDVSRDEKIDGVVGFGGGSSMDVAKLIAVLSRSNQTLSEIYGFNNVRGQRLPLVQVPTTAGTGSEVTPIAIITTGGANKMGVVSPSLLPDVAQLDAALTLGLPPAVTAATGIDAMVHAIEAYTSAIKKNPYSDMLARQALSLMTANIELAVHSGHRLDARQAMMLGATLAGQAFANAPVGGVHALAYPLGGHCHIPHGLSNALMLPHVMRFNVENAAPLYAELASLIVPDGRVKSSTIRDQADGLVNYLENLMCDLGLPNTLESQNVERRYLPELAAAAMQQQRLLINNPREILQRDALDIYQQAFSI